MSHDIDFAILAVDMLEESADDGSEYADEILTAFLVRLRTVADRIAVKRKDESGETGREHSCLNCNFLQPDADSCHRPESDWQLGV